MLKYLKIAAAIAVVGSGIGSANAADFYANKTVTFIVGLAAGGGSDLGCRLIAEYMGKHIAGNPTIIVKDMPSTDGVIGTNYVGKEAKKDGLTLFCGAFGPALQLVKDPSNQVDFTKFAYISGDGDGGINYIRSDVAPGIKSPSDIFKAQGIILGGNSVSSVMDLSMRGYMELLGLKYTYVTGYSGTGGTRSAIQQKFVNVIQEGLNSYMSVTMPSLVKSGEVVPIFLTGNMDADNHLYLGDDRLPNLPSFAAFYKAHFGKYPSGPWWDLEEAIHGMNNVGVNALMLPPGSPPEAVTAMRAAVGPLDADSDFAAASDKLRGPGVREKPGDVVQASYERFLDMPPTLVQAYKDAIASGQALARKPN